MRRIILLMTVATLVVVGTLFAVSASGAHKHPTANAHKHPTSADSKNARASIVYAVLLLPSWWPL
jgi:hypothetical protein